MGHRKRYVFVCVNRRPDGSPKGSCAARGAVDLHRRLKSLLQQRGLAQTEVRACTSSCLDACRDGPVVAVEPDHYFYGRVSAGDLAEIVDAFESGGRVERLVLDTAGLEAPGCGNETGPATADRLDTGALRRQR